ncbi:MAG: enoyl-CoA hydratase/isomerase family protein [Solirubrobacterales bacterium]
MKNDHLPPIEGRPFETLLVELGDDKVLTISLDRPDKLNSFNATMLEEFAAIWAAVRLDDRIHAVVLQAEGDRAFCTGVDVTAIPSETDNPWFEVDPGAYLSPKLNKVWKPVVCAVHGMAAGGAFYWLNEADLIVAADDAQFFDPHVSYGMTAALEPIGMTRRMPLGEVLRIALVGLDERVGAEHAKRIGLVDEVVPREQLRETARGFAARMAEKPPAAIQGTVRAIWESLDVGRVAALERGLAYTQIGNPIGTAEVDRATYARPKPVIR